MSLTLSNTAIITPDELARDNLSGVNIDFTSAQQQEALAAIFDVTQAIETYLDRAIICRQHTEYVAGWRWNYDEARSKYVFVPSSYPIVEITTSNVAASEDGRYLVAGSRVSKLVYTAGWKRRDQDKTTFGTSADPVDLPDDIRRVAIRLALYEMQDALQGTHATRRTQLNTGEFSATVDEKREDVYSKELVKLNKYRRLL